MVQHSDPIITPQDIRRFWSKVDTSGDCWLWMAGLTSAGYGQFSVRLQKYRAHRFAWIITHGFILPGFVLCHHCDTPRCVRPDHLFLGTVSENNWDRVEKGRTVTLDGERNGAAKLTEHDIPAIRTLLALGANHRLLAAQYGVDRSTITNIGLGKQWRHVT